ncbi:DegT/DnrJ/EryC1/StrS family aminotransferase [uncultured Sphaerochaeta sp.]|uniref:DegT/DnrJ/EryC1/StrS family aminotransferase n=1 Tax=uncultured Sphaerochaeta sp. TaxID=886478 RepID=UPI002A0A4782|nr:DegT/DnrJ/EryC1/StrS family aminotransferase [uncultured Sphaerochaeta sp.]
MEFRDLKHQYQVLKDKMDKAVTEVMTDCNFISGKQVKVLETELASYVGTTHCITCANGTDALSMMLMAWNIGPGDAVFVPDFTFFSTGEVVSFEGATPVFVDVNPDTYNMDPSSLEAAILAVEQEGLLKPKVVIPVDLFGLPADYEAINKIAKSHSLKVLEDGAQGFGGMCHGKRACSFGDAATTSFFPAKPLGCYGDGGAIFTNDDETAALLESLRVHGKGTFKYDNVRIGWNSRLDTLQAAVLLVKFQAFKEYELEDINKAALWYNDALEGIFKIPVIPEGYNSSWAQYTIQVESEDQRTKIQASLKEQGIPTMVYYPKPMHRQKAFEGLKQYVPCPITERLCQTVLSLPLHPYMQEGDCHIVANAIGKSF